MNKKGRNKTSLPFVVISKRVELLLGKARLGAGASAGLVPIAILLNMDVLKENKTDEEILSLSLEKPEVFAELVCRYRRPFLLKAAKIIGATDEAEDVVQDAFVRMYMNAEKFLQNENSVSFRAWAYRILYNTAVSAWRKKRRRGEVVENLPDEVISMIEDEKSSFLGRLYLADEILFVLSKMPVMLSRVVRYKLSGLSDGEIAKKEGISEGAVRVRFHRAKYVFQKISSKFNLFGNYYGEKV